MNMGMALLNMLRARAVAAKATQDAFFVAKTSVHAHKLVEPEPFKIPFGIAKLALVTSASLYFGGMLAKHGASFLEENEIFVPDEDDDD